MKNPNYAPEIYGAGMFVNKHSGDPELREFLYNMMHCTNGYTHSDRWSKIYNWMEEHYPEYLSGGLVTGLTYYCED